MSVTLPRASVGAETTSALKADQTESTSAPETHSPVRQDPRRVKAEQESWTHPETSMAGFDLVGDWRHRVRIGFVDEYLPIGPGPHMVVLEKSENAGGEVIEFEILRSDQAYAVYGSLTVNAMHVDKLRAFELATPDPDLAASDHTYPAGGVVHRIGDCWRLIGISPGSGCRSMNCTKPGGSACVLSITPDGDDTDSFGEASECVPSGYQTPLVTICPNGGPVFTCGMPELWQPPGAGPWPGAESQSREVHLGRTEGDPLLPTVGPDWLSGCLRSSLGPVHEARIQQPRSPTAVPASRGTTAQEGTVIDSLKINDTAGGMEGQLGFLERLGSSLVPLGDLNGDGRAELAVGASNDSGRVGSPGGVWILFVRS